MSKENINLRVAFLGYNLEQTKIAFNDFVRENIDQIRDYDLAKGTAELFDGTVVWRVDDEKSRIFGNHYDQYILADDKRKEILFRQKEKIFYLKERTTRQVPEDYIMIWYDFDCLEFGGKSNDGKTD